MNWPESANREKSLQRSQNMPKHMQLLDKKLVFFSSIMQISKLSKNLLYMLRNQKQNWEMWGSDENCNFSPASPLTTNINFCKHLIFFLSACCHLAFRRNVCCLHCKRPILASVFPSSWLQWAQCSYVVRPSFQYVQLLTCLSEVYLHRHFYASI